MSSPLLPRSGKSDNALDNAVLTFTVKAVQQKGGVSDADIASAREAGIDDSLMLEIVANIALHTLTNYTNRLDGTEIDFPVVQLPLDVPGRPFKEKIYAD